MKHRLAQSDLQAVAEQYARALLDLTGEGDAAAEVEEQLTALVGLVEADAQLREFLASPLIQTGQKTAVLDTALGGQATDAVRGALAVLVRKGRGALLPDVLAAYRDLRHRREGRVQVGVASARPLEAHDRQQLVEVLRDLLRAEPLIQERVEPALLGGLRVTVDDEVIDASVRGRLEQMRQDLLARGRRAAG